MSDEIQEQVAATGDEEAAADEVSEDAAPKKSVKFDHQNELSFDQAQAEIDAIKARAGQARENLKAVPASSTASYSTYNASSSSLEDDVPKSKNMLSHLNSNSAMINYKVTTARNLVQKQEALLRNLKMMRENMERSSVEISRASDYFSPIRVQPRGYFEKRAESAPLISRRHQVREVSPVFSASDLDATEQRSTLERAYSPVPLSISTPVSAIPPLSSADYEPDEEFEREMKAIRNRVANLSKQANEVAKPKYSTYDYESGLSSTYPSGYNDIYTAPQPSIGVKNSRSPKFAPKSYQSSLPPKTVYTSKHASVDNDVSFPHSSYTDYLMETVNNLDSAYPVTETTSLDLQTLHADPLAASSVPDYPIAY